MKSELSGRSIHAIRRHVAAISTGAAPMLRIAFAVKNAVFLVPALLSAACFAGPADDICRASVRQINALVDFARTDCTPAKDKSGVSLIYATNAVIMNNEKSKKTYLLVATAAAGKAIRESGARIERVNIMDKHLGSRREYFSLPASEAIRMQRAVSSGAIDIERMYSKILAVGAVSPIAR